MAGNSVSLSQRTERFWCDANNHPYLASHEAGGPDPWEARPHHLLQPELRWPQFSWRYPVAVQLLLYVRRKKTVDQKLAFHQEENHQDRQ